ncbi:hypothetical protein F5J12DRAFT_215054 [Pisolithus orientalis]|uniref:uncharacterized protein n=1 Tax=Pisolithus orientalis TaxID=936130 RepID=UPI0022255A3C|nr:uncharacterized protein F5J12DRAFT_215054 [Pisolithus orientalis]KAI6002421.1 hypothetical protein F5J12DRAFT_215054 [Pisolithus orientalis]
MPTQILMRLTQALGILLPPPGFATLYLVRMWTVTSRITIDVLRPGTSVTPTLCDSTDATVESAPFTVNAGTSIFCPHATSSIVVPTTPPALLPQLQALVRQSNPPPRRPHSPALRTVLISDLCRWRFWRNRSRSIRRDCYPMSATEKAF